jgi:uncharacterized protein CbrC (UPF0167 family)
VYNDVCYVISTMNDRTTDKIPWTGVVSMELETNNIKCTSNERKARVVQSGVFFRFIVRLWRKLCVWSVANASPLSDSNLSEQFTF